MASKTSKDRQALEKLLRYVLDTAPHEYGLVPADGGYVPVKELLAAIREEDGFRSTGEGRVMELVNQPGGVSPFETDGALIRLKPAFQKGPPPLPPGLAVPKELWAAIKPQGWRFAAEKGLWPRRPKETRITLYADKDLALRVAGRFCPDPVPVKVLAARASERGVVFSPFSETVWQADEIPAEYLSGPTIKPLEEKEPKKKAPPAPDTPMAALGFPLPDPQASHGKKKGRFGDSPDWKTQTRRDRRGGKDDR
jgi:RNA:NAD 2'-phosphotransferase (TPT1/KptA family)